jgi:uncharacterized protein (TIGR03083 family)
MIPHDTIAKLESLYDSVTELCEGLDESQWKTPTRCPGWSVQDNLSHMISGERMLEGLPATGHAAGECDHVKNPIGAMNENEVDSRRHLHGADVLAEWKEIVKVRRATLRGADDAHFDAPAMTPTGPGTVADFLHIRVLDIWGHEQDMRAALGIRGNNASPAAEHTVDRLIRTIPIVVGKRAETPEGATVLVRITGPVHRDVSVTVRNGRAVFDDSPATPITTVSMDSDSFVSLAMGRAEAGDPSVSVHIDGDRDLGKRIVGRFNMMI